MLNVFYQGKLQPDVIPLSQCSDRVCRNGVNYALHPPLEVVFSPGPERFQMSTGCDIAVKWKDAGLSELRGETVSQLFGLRVQDVSKGYKGAVLSGTMSLNAQRRGDFDWLTRKRQFAKSLPNPLRPPSTINSLFSIGCTEASKD